MIFYKESFFAGKTPFSGIIKLHFLFIWVLFIFQFAQANTHDSRSDFYKNIRFNRLDINDGLSQNLISAIHQDELGFMWIGTKDGLNMYDGYAFRIYKHDPFDPYSLSDNFIKAIFCDSRGRLWVGTHTGGLNLYDRDNNRFIRFLHDPLDENTIGSNFILSLVDDKHGNIWVGTSGGGLNRISFSGDLLIPAMEDVTISRFTNEDNDESINSHDVTSLFIDKNDLLWIGTHQGAFTYNTDSADSFFRQIPLMANGSDSANPMNHFNFADGRVIIFDDHDDEIWMFGRPGLFKYDSGSGVFMQDQYDYHFDLLNRTSYNPQAALSFNNKGENELWLSSEQGLTVYLPEKGVYYEMPQNNKNFNGLPEGYLISIYVDQSGTLWIGSNGYGLSIYDPYTIKFNHPDNQGLDLNGKLVSSRGLSMRAIYETDDGFLWLGANQGFFRVNRITSEFNQLLVDATDITGNMIVYSILSDHDGILWLGTTAGLVRFNPVNMTYDIYSAWHYDESESDDPRVSRVYFQNEKIWVLTPYSLALFDKETGKFDHFRYTNQTLNRYREMVFPVVYIDRRGGFWLGTHEGFHFFDETNKNIIHFTNDPQNPYSLPFNNIRTILPDPFEPENYLWLATGGGGLARFDVNDRTFSVLNENNGLANNMIYGMLPDQTGNFWLSTNHGLSKFNIAAREFYNYTVDDGLQSNEFNSGAFYKSKNGEMFFGGIRGYNSFFPEQVKHKEFQPPVVFTSFYLLTMENSDKELFSNISESENIYLKHNQNHFSIEFSALDLGSPHKNRFKYTLGDTYNQQWVSLGNNRNITFTNMKPGTYNLRVKGTNNDGVWSEHDAVLTIVIRRPWWTTNSAIVFYLLLISAIVLVIRKHEMGRLTLKNQKKLSELEANKLKDIAAMKSQFFANISHELRTPLTLIKGPVEDMMEETNDQSQKEKLNMMHSNAERLLTLINQLLDLSKLETGQYKLRVSNDDVISFVEGIVLSFSSLAQMKNIKLNFVKANTIKSPGWGVDFYYDRDILEKILANILSNAFKFTPSGGRVTVTACLRTLQNTERKFEITFRDTGIGIPAEKLPFIYDRFYQVDDSSKREYGGTGIGLAYVKELIELHKARISVMSKPGKGTVFRIRFDLGRSIYKDQMSDLLYAGKTETEDAQIHNYEDLQESKEAEIQTDNDKKPIVLIVEDNSEVRKYIGEGLTGNYQILEASDGRQGLDIATEKIPDLIISDIMMPVMDGYDYCQKIKTDVRTSHIPVILLTARADKQDKLHGLETGADDYLIKPFNPKELRIRVKNLIESRRLLREKFATNAIIKPSEISVTSRDKAFVEKLLKIVEANIEKESFSVDDFANETHMSPSQLHRKLKALVNQSATQFIRSVKMHRAKELLEKNAGNIAEVAYMVGFGDPGYFTRIFKTFFGVLPSDIRALSSK